MIPIVLVCFSIFLPPCYPKNSDCDRASICCSELNWADNTDGQQNDAERNHMQSAHACKHRPVAESEVEQLSNHQTEDNATHGAAKTDQAGKRAHHTGGHKIGRQ